MKICLVSPLPPPYGGISHWTELIHHAVAAQSDLELIQVDTAPRWRSIDDLNKIKRVLGGGCQLVRDFLVLVASMRKKPDVVHVTTSGSLGLVHSLVMCSTARVFRVPVVLHIRYGRVPKIAIKTTFEWHLLIYILQIADCVIAITRATAETIRNHLPNIQVEYIPNPIDCSEPSLLTSNVMPSRKMVLFIGWILPTKGVRELIQAWSQLDPEDWELVCVGPGSKAFQQALIRQFNPRNLLFAGELRHEQAMQWMAQCALFVLPSHTEGFPNVILEAMASGKAIIATSVGAIPEILSGDCGLLVPPKNVEELKTALARLMNNDALRRQLGQRALDKVRRDYCIPVIFEQYVKLWQSLSSK